jgi:hypothetical protein
MSKWHIHAKRFDEIQLDADNARTAIAQGATIANSLYRAISEAIDKWEEMEMEVNDANYEDSAADDSDSDVNYEYGDD